MQIHLPNIPKVNIPRIPPPEAVVLHNRMPDCVDEDSMAHKVLPTLLDIGEALYLSGADVNLIERQIRNMGYSYGAHKMNVLVITASIIVTMTLPDGEEHTQTRRIESAGSTDFDKLEKLSKLCFKCIDNPMSPEDLKCRFLNIKNQVFPRFSLYAGGMLSSSSFAIFFGGTILDGIVSALFAVIVCLLIEHFKPFTPNTIVFNFIASLFSGICICASALLVPAISADMVIIGDLMLLIPGVAMTNATRDMISGDTISGVMRLIESLLWATSLALGFMIAMWLFGVQDYVVNSNGTPLVQLISSAPASLGFALFFNVRKKLIPLATIGGIVTTGIYLAASLSNVFDSVFIPTLIASGFAAIYSEILSQKFKCPTSVFYIISVIPLVPGRGLYYTMQNAVQANWAQCGSFAFLTFQYATGIAIGIVIVWAFLRTILNFQKWRTTQKNEEATLKNRLF